MTNYVFATVAIGEEYRKKVRTLLDCVMNLTKGDLLIVTDSTDEIVEYVTCSDYDQTRIHLIDIKHSAKKIVTDDDIFNYNLKIVPVKSAYETGLYDLIIYCDADALLVGWDEASIQALIESQDTGIFARFRNPPKDELSIMKQVKEKAELLGIDYEDITVGLPIEVFMLIKTDCAEIKRFIEIWDEITTRSEQVGANPFAECFELAYAIEGSGIPSHHLGSYMTRYHVLRHFRYLHRNTIMGIF